jgi:PAS domain S-box-containing protein
MVQNKLELVVDYNDLMKSSLDMIYVIDLKGNFVDANEFALNTLGYNREEISEVSFENLIDGEQLTKANNAIKEIIKFERNSNYLHLKLKTKDGKFVFIETYGIPLRRNGKIYAIMGVANITKPLQKEIEKAKELDEIKREILTRASHELKTPITAIYGACQLLYEIYKNDLPEKALELVEISLRGGKRIQNLISNILDISYLESGRITLSKQKENIVELFKECIEEVSYLISKSNIEIFFDAPDEVYINIDKFQIEQVIINLLSNAIKNNPPNGKVFCKLKQNLKYIEISIKDTGIGIPEEEMHKIFKKFGKIERYGKGVNIDIEGAGLGLYISKQIVELHNGKIWAESEGLNKGTTLFISLPLK